MKTKPPACRAFVVAALAALILTSAPTNGAETKKPVWLVSNGFHTSLGFRTRDLPFAREISGDPRADAILIGWGATDFYEGRANAWTLCKALSGIGGSILHVVPVRGAISKRFSHSNIIALDLPRKDFQRLIAQIDRAFTRDPSHRPVFITRGYFADSRFYASRERFYFPKMCNLWVAEKLHRSGVRIFVPTSIAASELMWQAAKLGKRERWLQRPVDAF